MTSTPLTPLLEELSTLATELTDKTYQFKFNYLETTKQLSIELKSPELKKPQVRLISVKKTQSFLDLISKLPSQEATTKALVSFFNQNKVDNITNWNRWLNPELNIKNLTNLLNQPIWNVHQIQAKLKNNQQLFFEVIPTKGATPKSYALSKKDTDLLLTELHQRNSSKEQLSFFREFCQKTPSLKPMNLEKGPANAYNNLSILNEVLTLSFKRDYPRLLATQKKEGQLVLEIQPNTNKKIVKIPIQLAEGTALLKTLQHTPQLKEQTKVVVEFFKSCSSTKNHAAIKTLLNQVAIDQSAIIATKNLLQQKHQDFESAYLTPIKTLLHASGLNIPLIHRLWETQLATQIKGLPTLKTLPAKFKIKQAQTKQTLTLSTAFYTAVLTPDNNVPALQLSALATQIQQTCETFLHYFPLLCAASQAQTFIEQLNQTFLTQAKQLMTQRHYKSLYPFEAIVDALNHPTFNLEDATVQIDTDKACALFDLQGILNIITSCHEQILLDFEKVYQDASHCQTTLDPLTYYLLDVIRDLPHQLTGTYVDILKGHSLQHQKLDAFSSFRRFTRSNIILRYEEAVKQQLLKEEVSFLSLTSKGQRLLNLTPKPNLTKLLHYEDVKSLTHFIERLQNGETPDTLLLRLKRVSGVQLEELTRLLSFLQEDTTLYLPKKAKLVEVLAEIIPLTYLPFLELNSHLIGGIAQDVLAEIVQRMKLLNSNPSGGPNLESHD